MLPDVARVIICKPEINAHINLDTHINQQFTTLLSTRPAKFFELFSRFFVFLHNMNHLMDGRLERQSTSRKGAKSGQKGATEDRGERGVRLR